VATRTPLQQFMLAFPDGNPWEQAAHWYVQRPTNRVGEEIAAALAVDATGSHAIVGAIGSGKSTELHRAAERLRAEGARFVVALEDADLLGEGLLAFDDNGLVLRVLEALARALKARDLPAVARQLIERVTAREQRAAHGGPATLDPVRPEPQRELQELSGYVAQAGAQPVVLLDSLDRIRPPGEYVTHVVEQARRVSRCGVGLVVTASLEMRYLHWREQLQRFDRAHVLRHLHTSDNAERSFLNAVIAHRDGAHLLNDDARTRAVDASGGHMRSLIQLLRQGAHLANARGASRVEREDVDLAADALGEELAGEMQPSQRAALEAVLRGAVAHDVEDVLVNLLRDARVFNGSLASYKVHPMLEERMKGIAR